MGAIIRIEYDNKTIAEEDAERLSIAIQQIVADASDIKGIFVYANSAHIKVNVAPIEIFIEVNGGKVANGSELADKIAGKITMWKQDAHFTYPINLTVTPATWHLRLGL